MLADGIGRLCSCKAAPYEIPLLRDTENTLFGRGSFTAAKPRIVALRLSATRQGCVLLRNTLLVRHESR